jgi:hypothetical protein
MTMQRFQNNLIASVWRHFIVRMPFGGGAFRRCLAAFAARCWMIEKERRSHDLSHPSVRK